jgi:hypothetical protein
MTAKEQYKKLCEQETTIPIYSKPFWMDAVCGEDNWDVLLYEKGDEIVGALPYYVKKKFGLSYITQPKLTQTNGVWIKYPEGQTHRSRLAFEKEILTGIIDKLEQLPICFYRQSFQPSFTNWLPFYWKGYSQTTRYTYRIEDLKNYQEVYNNFSKVVRKNIRKAEPLAKIYESDDIEKLYSLIVKTFERQGLSPSNSLPFIKRLDNACKINNARKIFFAEDENGNLHCGSYIVYDENCVYQLMSGTDPEYRQMEFKTLLIIKALKFASEEKKVFDFEGSMIEGIEEFFRKFGATQTPYFSINKIQTKNPLITMLIKKKLGE